jgi:predicted nucleic acid-binding protein
MEAKCRGLIFAVQPVLDDLIVKAGFWISQELYRYILGAAGE